MFRTLGYSITALAALGSALLLGCAGQKPAAEAAPKNLTTAPRSTLSFDTPVEQIAADPRGKVILNDDIPGLLANPNYFMIENMNLSQIAAMSGGRITKAQLDLVRANLSHLSARGKTQQ
jgi:hypothetical protein